MSLSATARRTAVMGITAVSGGSERGRTKWKKSDGGNRSFGSRCRAPHDRAGLPLVWILSPRERAGPPHDRAEPPLVRAECPDRRNRPFRRQKGCLSGRRQPPDDYTRPPNDRISVGFGPKMPVTASRGFRTTARNLRTTARHSDRDARRKRSTGRYLRSSERRQEPARQRSAPIGRKRASVGRRRLTADRRMPP